MSAPLSNSGLRFLHNPKELPKFTLFISKPTRADLSTSFTRPTTVDDGSTERSSVESKPERLALPSMPHSNSSALVKVPTAPWMKGPLLVERSQVLDLSSPRTKKVAAFSEVENTDKSLRKVGSGRGKREMKKIFRGIEELQEKRSSEEVEGDKENVTFKFKFPPGELWGDGSSGLDEEDVFSRKENKLVDTKKSMEPFEFDTSRRVVEGRRKPVVSRKMPWDRDKKLIFRRVKEDRILTTAAELSLDKELLQSLRNEAARMTRWVKVKKAGVTQAVIDQVNLTWKDNELAMLKFDLPLSKNMERAREIVETKTGGMVVWRKKDALFVYRGNKELLPTDTLSRIQAKLVGSSEKSSVSDSREDTVDSIEGNSDQCSVVDLNRDREIMKENLLSSRSLYEKEADRLLDGLGPRFVDWWCQKPLPVDGDLLPEMVPGFQPPVRLCPPHSKSRLTDNELTYLRNYAHALPIHFVLGRNKKLQGLAVAILKLWEKCHIAKIAIKWGVPNTDNKQMAYELKCLTGGVLLLRNKFIIILYRGKDFLPSQVGELVAERESEIMRCQLWEETARLRASEAFASSEMLLGMSSALGTLSEFHSIQSEHLIQKTKNSEVEVHLEAEKQRLEKELRNQQRKLLILNKKIATSDKRLAELDYAWEPAEKDADQEMMTQEERECLRQVGLKMHSTLVLGRRGVFCGVIESLHQHWKYREVAKVITMQRRFSQVIFTAKFLEAESKGMLVSIEKLKKGHAVIIYRGKNYRRPKLLSNLLDKREALSRSLEMQRVGSLKYFAKQREQTITSLKSNLAALMEHRV